MISRIYTIRDRVAEESSPLFCSRNDNSAIRQAFQLLEKSSVSLDDFFLVCLGTFDDTNSLIQLFDIPVSFPIKGEKNE